MTGRPTAMTWLGSATRLRRPVRTCDLASTPDALETVYRQCHVELHRYVRSLVRDADLADDVLQAAMVRAIAALRGEDRDFELRPWLFRIAHHEAIDRLRRDRPTDGLDAAAQDAPAAPSAADVATQRADMEQLWRDLQDLGERPRQALVLRELNGLSHEEIGAILGTSTGGAKQTIFEARRALLSCSEGRAMQCDDVQRILSDGDGRVRRSRPIRAHVADCTACRAFDAALSERPDQLAMLVPAAPLAGAAALGHLLHGAEPAHATIGAASSATAAGSSATTAGLSTAAGTAASVSGATSAAVTTSVGSLLTAKVALAAVAGAAALGGAGVATNDVVKAHRAGAAPSGGAVVRPADAGPSAARPGTATAAAASSASGTPSVIPASSAASSAPPSSASSAPPDTSSGTTSIPGDTETPPRSAAQPATTKHGAGQPAGPSRPTNPERGAAPSRPERGASGPQQRPSRPDTPAAAKPEPKPDPGRKSAPPAGASDSNGPSTPATGAGHETPPAAAGKPSPPAGSDSAGKAPTNAGGASGGGPGAAADRPTPGGGSAGREADSPAHSQSRP